MMFKKLIDFRGEEKIILIDEFKEVKQIGEIIKFPKFDDVVYDEKQKEFMKLAITKMKTEKINLLFSGLAGCFAEGTKILTPFGKRNIEDATFVYSKGKGIEIKPCIVVPTFKQVVEIELENGFKIYTSPEHLFYRNNQLIQSKDLKTNDYLDIYDKTKLCNLWKRNESFPFTRKEQEILFKEVSLYCLERTNERKKQSLLFKEFSKGNNRIIPKESVFNKINQTIWNIKKNNYKQIKGKWNKDKNFQRTSKNRSQKTRNEGIKEKTNDRKIEPSIQKWLKSWTKSEQEDLFTNSKTNKRMEMCKLFINRQTQRLGCSSYRWKQYQQLSKKFNSFMSGLSFKTTPNKIKIKSIRTTKRTERMFDLIVPDTNNFFLENGLLVHNTGKTYSSKMCAVETQKPFVYITGSMGKSRILEMLQNLKPNALVLIDEIHNLSERIGEIIYPAIEYGEIYLDGERKKIDCCFIGTTTEPEKLPKPLLERFMRIEFYEPNDGIVKKILDKMNIPIEVQNFLLNYTSNIRVLKKLIQYIKMYGEVNEMNCAKVFRMMKINLYSGLSNEQDNYIEYLKKVKKASLRNLGLILRRSENYLKLDIEPELIKKGIIIITSKGRELAPEFKDVGYEQLQNVKTTKFKQDDRQRAINWLNDNPEIKEQFSSMYLELVNFIAEKIKEGIEPDTIDFMSFGTDTSIEQSYNNNYKFEEL